MPEQEHAICRERAFCYCRKVLQTQTPLLAHWQVGQDCFKLCTPLTQYVQGYMQLDPSCTPGLHLSVVLAWLAHFHELRCAACVEPRWMAWWGQLLVLRNTCYRLCVLCWTFVLRYMLLSWTLVSSGIRASSGCLHLLCCCQLGQCSVLLLYCLAFIQDCHCLVLLAWPSLAVTTAILISSLSVWHTMLAAARRQCWQCRQGNITVFWYVPLTRGVNCGLMSTCIYHVYILTSKTG
jgi:hypothetical protein